MQTFILRPHVCGCQRLHTEQSRKQQRSLICCQAGYTRPSSAAAHDHVERRALLAAGLIPTLLGLAWATPPKSSAIGFKKELKKRKVPEDQYTPIGDGVKVYDLTTGNGSQVASGQKVTVHFDCLYKGIDVASSRSARLLGGNRTIAEPFDFTAGTKVSNVVKKINDSANGLFAGAGGPKPPPALSNAVIGMKVGGKRSVLVPPEMGYGAQGLQEIPPNSTFELQIELLNLR